MDKLNLCFTLIFSFLYFIKSVYFNEFELHWLLSFVGFIPGIYLSSIISDNWSKNMNAKSLYEIFSDKKCLIPFSIFYSLLIIHMINNFSIKNSVINVSLSDYFLKFIFLCIGLLLTLFAINLFINLNNFNFKISKNDFLLVLICFFIISIFKVLFIGKTSMYIFSLYNKDLSIFIMNILNRLLNLIVGFICPAFIEEFIFRGLLISGLKGLKFSPTLCNIIQAIAFGLIHLNHYPDSGFIGITGQILLGYVLGKVYYSTSSLTASSILHTFLNVL